MKTVDPDDDTQVTVESPRPAARPAEPDSSRSAHPATDADADSTARRGVLSWVGDTWRAYRADVGALALLWGLCLVFFWRLFSPVEALRLHVVHGDFTNQFYPFRYFAAMEWRAGRVPLWNPYVFAGHPFLADVQTAVFYPVSLANALGGAAFGFPLEALELEMAAHYPLAALFTYLLARQLVGSRLGATVAAVAFTFSGFLTSYPALQLPMLETAVWLPLILLFAELGATRRAAPHRWHVAAGLSFGICILAGHPQTALFVAYTSLAYLAYRTLSVRRDWRPVVAGAGVFLATGFGLAAVQVLPTLELFGLSTRVSLPYEAAAHGYDRRALLGILLPTWRGERALYVGVAPLLLAALAVVWAILSRSGSGSEQKGGAVAVERQRGVVLFLAALAALSVVLSLGGKGYLFRLFYLLAPGFALFRDQERIIYLFALSASLLAGFGASYLFHLPTRGKGRARIIWWGLAAGLLVGVAGSVALLYLGRRLRPVLDPSGALVPAVWFLLAFLLASGAVLYLRRLTNSRRLVGLCLLGVIVADVFAVNLDGNLAPGNPDPGPRYATIVAALRTTPEEYRVRGENDEAFPSNYAAVWRVPTISGDTPFALRRTDEFLRAHDAEWRRWQVLNVKYFVSRGAPFEGIELALESGDLKVYRMIYSLPRAWAVRDVQVAEGPADALRRVLAPAYHPGDTVILEEPTAIGPFVKGQRPDVRIAAYSPQRVEIEARADGNAMLVLADAYYPGWQALLDGTPVKLHRANFVARAVELPSGEHRVEFVYEPLPFKIGAVLSALTAVAAMAGLLLPSLVPAGRGRSCPTRR